jgi:Protein of unknown function (DUF3775)
MPEDGSKTLVTQIGFGAPTARPELDISLEKVCFVIAKARELDVKVAPEELDDASDEDMMQRILEDYADAPTFEELQSFLRDQNDDELKELLALAWLGRGDFSLAEWRDGLGQVRDVRQHHTADYLLGTPLLADFLEEGLSQFGLSCEEFELGRM